MTRLRSFVPLLLLAASCATTRIPVEPPPPPAPIVTEPIVRELVDVGAQHSTFLDVSSGYANVSASIGGETGVRSAWFRFVLHGPGEADVTLSPVTDSLLSVALFDDAVVLHPETIAPEIGYRQTTSSPQSIGSDLTKGVYYIEVTCGPKSPRADFVVSVSFRPDPTPQAAVAPPSQRVVRIPQPIRPPKWVPPPAPTPAPKPVPTSAPVAAPPMPTPVPPPPALLTPERVEATPLPSGSSAMTDIGGESGYRWRWYEVTLTRKGKLRLDVTASGAPVEVVLFDEKGKEVGKLDVERTATHSGRHSAGKMFIRVGPAANDAAARVTVELKVAVAPFIKEEK